MVCQPLDMEAAQVLSAMHVYQDCGRVAQQLGMRRENVRRVLRRSERSKLVRLSEDSCEISSQNLRLIRASLAYHNRLRRSGSTSSFSTNFTPVRIAAVGSGYYGLAQCMATNAQQPRLLHLFEETPQNAIRRLDAGEVDAAYVWEDSNDVSHPYQRRLIASEQLMLAMTRERAHELGHMPTTHSLTSLAWVTTPSGLSLMNHFLEAAGVTSPTIEVVDCVLTVSGLVHTGGFATLVSPLSLATGLEKVYPAIDIRRDLVLLTDQRSTRDVDLLQTDLQDAFRDLSHQRIGRLAEGTYLPSTPTPVEVAEVTDKPNNLSAHSLSDDDLRQLRAVRDLGSVNRAAKELALSQPALSRRIARMESKAATRLILRSSTGSSLSPAALGILHDAALAEQEFRDRINSRI